MKSKFFNLLDPLFNSIDNGIFFKTPFRWFYMAIGIVTLLTPQIFTLSAIIGVFDNDHFIDTLFELCISIVLSTSAIASFIFWIKCQNRLKENININRRYIAITMVSNFIKTLFEWLGLYIGTVGTLLVLIMTIFAKSHIHFPILEDFSFSLIYILIYPIIGYVIILSGHFCSEMLKVLTDIAENTKRN